MSLLFTQLYLSVGEKNYVQCNIISEMFLKFEIPLL